MEPLYAENELQSINMVNPDSLDGETKNTGNVTSSANVPPINITIQTNPATEGEGRAGQGSSGVPPTQINLNITTGLSKEELDAERSKNTASCCFICCCCTFIICGCIVPWLGITAIVLASVNYYGSGEEWYCQGYEQSLYFEFCLNSTSFLSEEDITLKFFFLNITEEKCSELMDSYFPETESVSHEYFTMTEGSSCYLVEYDDSYESGIYYGDVYGIVESHMVEETYCDEPCISSTGEKCGDSSGRFHSFFYLGSVDCYTY